eukprot:Skav223018  [mRNA]  locus=scaffold1422:123447:124481:- [translate_table: standard]
MLRSIEKHRKLLMGQAVPQRCRLLRPLQSFLIIDLHTATSTQKCQTIVQHTFCSTEFRSVTKESHCLRFIFYNSHSIYEHMTQVAQSLCIPLMCCPLGIAD